MGKLVQALKGLLYEPNGTTVSLGRIAFWATFILALVLWGAEKSVVFYHFLTLCFLLLYNLGKKALWAWVEIRKLITGNGNGGGHVGTDS